MSGLGFLMLVGSYGALALVSQVLIIRQLLTAFYGGEMIVALVMAGWLAGVWLGAKAGGLIDAGKEGPRAILFLTTPVWCLILFGLLWLSYYLPGLTGLGPGETVSLEKTITWSAILTIPASFFVGFLFVQAGAFWNENMLGGNDVRHETGGVVFLMESGGSCLGLLFYTFFLVGRTGPIQIMTLFIGLVLFFLVLSLPRLLSAKIFFLLILTVVSCGWHFTGLGQYLGQYAEQTRFSLSKPGYVQLAYKETPYQHLTVASRGKEFSLFGNQSFMGSWPDPYHYQVMSLFFLTEATRTENILLVGQGPGGFIHELLKPDVKNLTYITTDPDEINLVVDHLTPEQTDELKDPRLKLVYDDPRVFMSQSGGQKFDLIIINAPDPDNARINRLYTLEFFQAARKRLTERGVFITSISGAENYWGGEIISYGRSLYYTLDRVFPEILVTPGDRHYFICGATPGLVSDDPEALATRYKAKGLDSAFFTPRSFSIFFPETGTKYIKDMLTREPDSRINTDLAPLSYFLRLAAWEKMTGEGWGLKILETASQARKWAGWLSAILAAPLIFIFLRPSPAGTSSITMLYTGGVCMALEIILIFLFQNKHGVLYMGLGLISALFMAGLTTGGLIGRVALNLGLSAGQLISWLEFFSGPGRGPDRSYGGGYASGPDSGPGHGPSD